MVYKNYYINEYHCLWINEKVTGQRSPPIRIFEIKLSKNRVCILNSLSQHRGSNYLFKFVCRNSISIKMNELDILLLTFQKIQTMSETTCPKTTFASHERQILKVGLKLSHFWLYNLLSWQHESVKSHCKNLFRII